MKRNSPLLTNTIDNVKKVFQKLLCPPQRNFYFFYVGFHGDKYLLEIVDLLVKKCDYFIETGSQTGSTLAYMSRTYPDVHCISCEPDDEAFQRASQNISAYQNVDLYNETSQDFIERFRGSREILDSEVLFWLDAHGHGFEWPLREEVSFITTNFKRAFILIDDFKVPGLDCFGYDEHQGQICAFDYVKDVLNKRRDYRLYYPQYTKRTSQYHPLRGWGLIEFGHANELNLPEDLRGKVRLV